MDKSLFSSSGETLQLAEKTDGNKIKNDPIRG
jgi:hypothetical protein